MHHSICNDKWLIGRSNVKILQLVTAAPRNGPSLVQKDLKSMIRCDSHDAKCPSFPPWAMMIYIYIIQWSNMIDVYPPTPATGGWRSGNVCNQHLAMCKGNRISGCLSSFSSQFLGCPKATSAPQVAWARILLVLRYNLAVCSFCSHFDLYYFVFKDVFLNVCSMSALWECFNRKSVAKSAFSFFQGIGKPWPVDPAMCCKSALQVNNCHHDVLGATSVPATTHNHILIIELLQRACCLPSELS